MGIKLGFQIGLVDVYPEEKPEDLGEYLNGIPRDTVLLVVSSLLGRKEIYSGSIKDILSIWFRSANNEFANDAYQRLLRVESRVKQPISIISQPSVLKIFTFANNYLTESKTITDEQIEINLFKAFLYQNELINRIEVKITNTTELLDKKIQLYALQFTSAVRFSDIVNFDLNEIFFTEFVRAVLFFEFLEKNPTAVHLLREFYNHYMVCDWRDYLKRISGLSLSILNKKKDGHIDFNITHDDHFEDNCQFIDRLAAVKYDELTDSDFIKVRERPLHKLNEGNYRVISELFTIERIFKGLYFNLKSVNANLDEARKVENFRYLYTYHFSEQQSLYDILEKTFPKKHIAYSGETMRINGVNGAPDYYVRNKNKIFIFESKDSLLNATLKESGDFSLIEPDLIKKFYQDGGKAKAVNQILYFVRSLLLRKFSLDKEYNPETIRIYPIIVIHDRQLDVVGLNKIINEWFLSELEKIKVEIKGKIYPITVIDMPTLILIHELLLDRRLQIEEVVEEYHESTKWKEAKDFSSSLQFEKYLMNTGIPFSNFIKGEIKRRKLPRIPARLIKQKAIIALEPEIYDN